MYGKRSFVGKANYCCQLGESCTDFKVPALPPLDVHGGARSMACRHLRREPRGNDPEDPPAGSEHGTNHRRQIGGLIRGIRFCRSWSCGWMRCLNTIGICSRGLILEVMSLMRGGSSCSSIWIRSLFCVIKWAEIWIS